MIAGASLIFPLASQPWLYVYIAVGAILFWSVKGREGLQVYALEELLNHIKLSDFYRKLLELTIFVIFGCIVAAAIVQPTTAAQALTAGFGWTGLLSHNSKKVRTLGRRS